MSINDKDRKILWGRSGNLCALCKIVLIADKAPDDLEAVIGEEAHIAARSPRGPRYGECDPEIVDTYDNLILLCRIDHKIVDDQPNEFTTERLRRMKVEHELWVSLRLRAEADEPEPMRIEVDTTAPPVRLEVLATGGAVWDIVSSSHAYRLGDLDETSAVPEQLDAAAEFLQLARDWGEVSGDVVDRGMIAVREATASLGESVRQLADHGLMVFGGRRRLIVKGGMGPPSYWHEAILEIVRADSPRHLLGEATS